MEWVEAQGKTVDGAIKAAITELGLDSPDQATVEVIQEPTAGFLGLGGKEAIVKVTRKPKRSRRRRSRSGRSGEGRSSQQKKGNGKGGKKNGAQVSSSRRNRPKNETSSKPDSRERPVTQNEEPRPEAAPIETQAEVAAEFLNGLLDAFGLEGDVTTRVEEDILWMDVSGGQTEALVGQKGAVMQSVLELTRTVVQRKTFGAPRMRLDIAGYGERRREALGIYTTRLTERLKADGGEIMLEPMNAADRKVIHDSVVEIEGVRSFSEGEEPNRAVILSLEEGYGPAKASGGGEETDDDDDTSSAPPSGGSPGQ